MVIYCDWVGLLVTKTYLVINLKAWYLRLIWAFSTRIDNGVPKLKSKGFGELLDLMDLMTWLSNLYGMTLMSNRYGLWLGRFGNFQIMFGNYLNGRDPRLIWDFFSTMRDNVSLKLRSMWFGEVLGLMDPLTWNDCFDAWVMIMVCDWENMFGGYLKAYDWG